jgi:hypothetical protein
LDFWILGAVRRFGRGVEMVKALFTKKEEIDEEKKHDR